MTFGKLLESYTHQASARQGQPMSSIVLCPSEFRLQLVNELEMQYVSVFITLQKPIFL